MRSLLLVSLIFLVVQTENINADGQIRGRLLTPTEGCGYPMKKPSTRIVGGTTSQQGRWPWMAMIGYLIDGGEIHFGCAGSLITSRHVLTAAHCISDEMTPDLVRLGEHDTKTLSDADHEDINVVRIDTHPKYDKRDFTNDVAVLTLERDVTFAPNIAPVCLPINEPLRSWRFERFRAFIAGWGLTKEKGDLSHILNMVELPIIDNKSCKAAYQKIGEMKSEKQFSDVAMCAGLSQGGKDSCQGDSGGPLMLPIDLKSGKSPVYQIGIVSFGIGCARPGVPGVYTRVTTFVDWIQEKIRQK